VAEVEASCATMFVAKRAVTAAMAINDLRKVRVFIKSTPVNSTPHTRASCAGCQGARKCRRRVWGWSADLRIGGLPGGTERGGRFSRREHRGHEKNPKAEIRDPKESRMAGGGAVWVVSVFGPRHSKFFRRKAAWRPRCYTRVSAFGFRFSGLVFQSSDNPCLPVFTRN